MDEDLRKLVHIGFGLPIFLLLVLNWWQASIIAFLAFIHNIYIIPLYWERILRGKWDRGIIFYPLSVLLMILLCRSNLWLAASGWSLLAFSDGAASVVGRRAKAELPWNKRKTYLGTGTFIISGLTLSPFFFWLIKGNISSKELWIIIFSVVITGILESLQTGIEDNLVVPFSFLFFFKLGSIVKLKVPTELELKILILIGILAIFSFILKVLDLKGAISAFFVGSGILLFGGVKIFYILLSFFLLSEAATFYKEKEKEGVKRKWASVWAKGGPALLFSILGLPQAAVISLAEATYDTVGTEIGSVSGGFVFSLLRMGRAKKGEPGGISFEGTISALISASVLILFSIWLGIEVNYSLAILLVFGINLLEPLFKVPCKITHSFSNFIISFIAGETYLFLRILL